MDFCSLSVGFKPLVAHSTYIFSVFLSCIDRRFYHDDTTAVHQLQTEVGRALAVAYDDIQSPKYIYRWYFCICHSNANHVQDRMLPRRYLRPTPIISNDPVWKIWFFSLFKTSFFSSICIKDGFIRSIRSEQMNSARLEKMQHKRNNRRSIKTLPLLIKLTQRRLT